MSFVSEGERGLCGVFPASLFWGVAASGTDGCCVLCSLGFVSGFPVRRRLEFPHGRTQRGDCCESQAGAQTTMSCFRAPPRGVCVLRGFPLRRRGDGDCDGAARRPWLARLPPKRLNHGNKTHLGEEPPCQGGAAGLVQMAGAGVHPGSPWGERRGRGRRERAADKACRDTALPLDSSWLQAPPRWEGSAFPLFPGLLTLSRPL